jgi:hypothetical protein
LLFLRKSVVLTSTMSSKHSYARSGERREKTDNRERGRKEEQREERDMGKGERANNWTEHGG